MTGNPGGLMGRQKTCPTGPILMATDSTTVFQRVPSASLERYLSYVGSPRGRAPRSMVRVIRSHRVLGGSGWPMTLDGMRDADLAYIIRVVSTVARLGEKDQRGWWGTSSFGAAGRVVLGRRLPRTWRMAAVELDIAAAASRHNDVLDRRNAVHLFSDNWPVRRWTSAWVAEQKTADPADRYFEQLESASVEQLVGELGGPQRDPETGSRAVRVGAIGKTALDSPEAVHEAVGKLAAVYAGLDGSFVVPYLEIDQ